MSTNEEKKATTDGKVKNNFHSRPRLLFLSYQSRSYHYLLFFKINERVKLERIGEGNK